MNILITGFNGFLGKNLYFFLKKKKLKLFGIGRQDRNVIKTYKSKKFINTKNKSVTIKNIKNFNTKFSFIIHCAGSGKVYLSKKKHNRDNLKATKSLLNYVKKYDKFCRIVIISSISVFGHQKKSINSTSKINPISYYAKSKLGVEIMCENYSKKYNLNIIILRISSLYGNGMTKQFIYDSLKKIYSNNNLFHGAGDEIRDFVHISDVIKLIFKIIKKGFIGLKIINCGSAKGHKIKNILKYIIMKTNKRIEPIFNNKYLSINPRFLKFQNVGNNEFNWKPKKFFFEGLNQYINWYKKNYL